MSEVKRFDTGTDNTHYYGVPVMEECEDGDYVLSADYDALKAERDQLRAELAAIRASEPVGEVCDGHQAGVIFYTWRPCPESGTKLYTAPQPQPDVQALVELLERVQVSLSLDDTEWGYRGTEKYTLLADIRAKLASLKQEPVVLSAT